MISIMGAVPRRYQKFLGDYPDIAEAYRALGDAVAEAGPLDPPTRQLVKIGISSGARNEGALRSHVRKALEAGCTPEEIRHAILQATTTVGFPTMMAAMSWADSVMESDSK